MKVTFIYDGSDHGSNYYRAILPWKALQEHSEDCKVAIVRKGDPSPHVIRALEADLYVIPRLEAMEVTYDVSSLQAIGKKIITDYDDDIFNVSPLSPHYIHFGTENVQYKLDSGEIVPLWEHGKNINIVENKMQMKRVRESIGKANCLTVTTDILAGCYKSAARRVAVLPNCIDIRLWNKLDFRKNTDDIRLFWAGGASHYEDWNLLPEVLVEIMRKYQDVKLVILGQMFKGTLKDIPPERIEFHNWVHSEAYPYKTAILDPDICIIPLVDNQFNECKSPIKFIEMSALRVPCVVSHVSPYKEVMTEDNGVFIEGNDKEGWFRGISLLIDDVLLRKHIGTKAREYVEANFDINKEYVRWEKLYKELVGE